MKKITIVVLFLIVSITPKLVQAQELAAQQAAESILQSFSKQEYLTVWNSKTSQWAKTNWDQNAFLASMSIGRPQLGTLQTISVIAREHTTHDPSTGFDGDIYAITFRNKYTNGEFFERLVVVKDPDGQYRLSGIYGSPVPNR